MAGFCSAVDNQLTDAEVPPAWNGRAGTDAGASISVPAIPVVAGTEPNFDQFGDADGLIVLMAPGADSAATVATFTLRHRLEGTSTWNEVTVDAADGAAVATGYDSGDTIEMQRLATSIEGYSSDWSSIFTAEGAINPSLPAPAPISAGSVTGGVGEVDIVYSTPNDYLVEGVTVFYGPNEDGSGSSLLVSAGASPSRAYTQGTTTRINLSGFMLVEPGDEIALFAYHSVGSAINIGSGAWLHIEIVG